MFSNVKVGDIVLVPKNVRISWNRNKMFYLPQKVVKISATQFTTEDGTRAKKDSGSIIGDTYANICIEGGISRYGRTAKDETKEYKELTKKLKLQHSIKVAIDIITRDLTYNSNLSVDDLERFLHELEIVKNNLTATKD